MPSESPESLAALENTSLREALASVGKVLKEIMAAKDYDMIEAAKDAAERAYALTLVPIEHPLLGLVDVVSKKGVCIHGGLRRQCETCDLAERLDALQVKADRLREALIQQVQVIADLSGADDWKGLKEARHALAACQAGTGAVDAKEVFTWETCPKHEWRTDWRRGWRTVVCIHCQMPGEQLEDGTVFFPAT